MMKTPKEIKKGLDLCKRAKGDSCDKCPYQIKPLEFDAMCIRTLEADALTYIQQLEAAQPKWISVKERLPEHWQRPDSDRTLMNYLVYSPEYGVDIGNYIKPAGVWVIMGISAKVSHWMPLPPCPNDNKEE